MKNYIKINIVNPLNNALRGRQINREKVIEAIKYCNRRNDAECFDALSQAMLPFYKVYFYADSSIVGYQGWEIREVIRYSLETDDSFFQWVSDRNNFFECAYSWVEYQKKSCQSHNADAFLDLLQCMSVTFYSYECPISLDEIRQILINERIEGNSYSREIYCIVHAFIVIWNEEHLSLEQKITSFKLLHKHWNFIRALYSAMLQQVVGYGFTEIASVVHCVKKDLRHNPHLHLLYSAVMEHKEKIIRNGTKSYKLENALNAIREIIVSGTTSNELDDLCMIIFSNKLKQYLEKHRLKSYRELESEVDFLQRNLERNINEMQSLIDKQVEMLSEKTISVEVISNELNNLSSRFPGMAYEVYEKLNALLIKNEVWTKYSAHIRDMIWERMQQPAIQATNYYAQGSIHNDESKHISLTNDKKQIKQA